METDPCPILGIEMAFCWQWLRGALSAKIPAIILLIASKGNEPSAIGRKLSLPEVIRMRECLKGVGLAFLP